MPTASPRSPFLIFLFAAAIAAAPKPLFADPPAETQTSNTEAPPPGGNPFAAFTVMQAAATDAFPPPTTAAVDEPPAAPGAAAPRPPVAEFVADLGTVSDRMTAARNEDERASVLRDEAPRIAARIEGPPPPGVDPARYRRVQTEMANVFVQMGWHPSTSDKDRRSFAERSVGLTQQVLSNSDEKSEVYRDALNLQAQAEFSRGRYQQAADAASNAARLRDDDQRAYTTRALAYYQMGRYAQAMEDAKRALRLDPNNETAFKIEKLAANRLTTPSDLQLDALAKAAAAKVSRDYESMEESRSRAERGQERVVDSLNSTALSQIRLGRPDAAMETASRALEKNPHDLDARKTRAAAAGMTGRWDDALQDSNALLAADPANTDALLTQSQALVHLGRFAEAKASAERAAALAPTNPYAYKALGLAKEGLGDISGMTADLRRASALGPQLAQELRPTALRYGFSLEPAGPAALPQEEDILPELAADERKKTSKNKRFMIVLLSSVTGGLLISAGAVQIFLSARREKKKLPIPAAETNAPFEAVAALEGGFKLLRVLGNGGMGIVYEAEDKALGRKVAIKKMRDEIHNDERERSRFLQEARLVAKLHHPNIVDIHSILEENGELYLVFEHVDGETIDQLMARRRRLALNEAQYIMRGVCHALEYAHQKAVIHRDLKPSNMMITTEGRVKVMDFGIARQAKDALAKSTSTQTVTGTPQYMAPEQEEGSVRPENDVFSLGACLYEMLTGERPFPGPATTASKLSKNYVRATRLRAELPLEIDRLIDDALEPDPEKRIRSAAEFRQRLDAIAVPSAPLAA